VRAFGSTKRIDNKIIYTETDEAPNLATYSLLPVINRFTKSAGIPVDKVDISVAARIIAQFPDYVTAEQRVDDELAKLGELCTTPEANVIKLPNVSASIPQLNECIAELQSHGYNIPSFPQSPSNAEEEEIYARYAKVLGSAVNPVLREGNSDRRVAGPVKDYAQKFPHRMMKPFSPDCASHVSSMTQGDFFENEQSTAVPEATSVKIELIGSDGTSTVLKESVELEAGEVIDASYLSTKALCEYYEKEISNAHSEGIMVSLHLKATMMKVSDPILFGHCVKVFFKDAFAKHADALASVGANPNNGLGAVLDAVSSLPNGEEITADFLGCIGTTRPELAYVDSNKGITNLHVPSDVIIDASMPVVVRDSGKMWGIDDALHDTKCLIPDRSYAGIYNQMLDFCRQNGAFDPATMGNVSNVGLMAKKAEEYGSHDKTFEVPRAGTIKVTDASGKEVFSHNVEQGDLWRMCQAKDAPIQDWVKLAVSRARATGDPAVFWLDEKRGHDNTLIGKVNEYLPQHDTAGLDIQIMKPVDAIQFTMERAVRGENTISVTGNVLRDYLTDLFPILELGTSAKMLSIVPLLQGGALFETGAGGSAPKHVQQFVKEGHLRWDSLGEFLAIAVSLEHAGSSTGNKKAAILAETLNEATKNVMFEGKSPSRKVNEIDNRGSHFYLALYWAEALAQVPEFADEFGKLAADLKAKEAQISQELIDCQGNPEDLGGYYRVDPELAERAMRPSPTFNALIDNN
jgi:isocitrate dehydrogenase